jgi:hypothetical protein
MAEEYELGTVGPIPTVNPNVAKIGEMLKIAKKYADQYYVKDYVPLIGGTTLGEFLLGKAPEEVERWGQGDSPFRNPSTVVGTGGNRLDVWKAGRFEPTFDVLANVALPAVGTGQMAARPIVRTLGPKAAEMAEDYLTKQGAIANIVEPSPKKVVEPFSAIDELGFHSPLENAILKIQQPKGTGDQFLKQLEKTPGVKTEELDVTGIKQYLLDHPTVTKQELLDQMATSRLKLEQKVLGEDLGDSSYANYKLQGGDVIDDEDYIRGLADDFHYDMKNDDVLRKQEREALLEADPERYADIDVNPYSQARLEEDIDGVLYELAKQQADEMYYLDPIRHYYDEFGNDIYGNDSMGYTVKDPNGNYIKDVGDTYNIDSVQNNLADLLAEQGILSYEGKGAAKFEDYTLPGNYENYREILTTYNPQKEPARPVFSVQADTMSQSFDTKAEAEAYKALLQKQYPDAVIPITQTNVTANPRYSQTPDFQSSHFDEPNILAHTRLNDRIINGKKTLFVEEIQSDWHQAGRKKGYQEQLLTDAERKRWNELKAKDNKNAITDADRPEFQALAEKVTAEILANKEGVPNAPFKKNWHELMMKQILNEAVKGDYEAVAFTTGKQQADRYNLQKHVNLVSAMPTKEGKYNVYLEGKDGDPLFRNRNGFSEYGQKDMTPEEIEATLGKDVAKKLIEGTPNKEGWVDVRDKDLAVGGEGMKGFYDKILPDYINKYGKKYGIGVKKANLEGKKDNFVNFKDWVNEKDPSLNYSFITDSWKKEDDLYKEFKKADIRGEEVHYFDLSDMAKKDIKEKGQPLFSGIGLAPAPLLFDEEDN